VKLIIKLIYDTNSTFTLKVIFPKTSFKITKEHYDTFIDFINTIKLKKEVKRTYLMYRPLYSVKENPKEWWKYAMKSIKKEQKVNSVVEMFYERKFSQVFIKEYMKAGKINNLDKRIYDKAIRIFELDKLYSWEYKCLYQVQKDIRQEENKNKPGLLTGFLSWGASKKEVKEEKKESVEDKLNRILKGRLKEINEKPIINEPIPSFGLELEASLVEIELISLQSIELALSNLFIELKSSTKGLNIVTSVTGINMIGIRRPDDDINLITTKALNIVFNYSVKLIQLNVSMVLYFVSWIGSDDFLLSTNSYIGII